jgi:exosortase
LVTIPVHFEDKIMSRNPTKNITVQIARHITPRNILFLFFNIATIIMFYAPLRDLIALSLHNANYSHIVLIPFISGYFIYLRRKAIFADIHYSYAAGIILILTGGILYLIGKTQGINLDQNDYVSLMTLSGFLFWMGGFVLFYGIRAFRTGAFPLLFLIFLVPLPDFIMEKIIILLQLGSAEVTYVFFKLTGIAFLREGVVFHLPGISIEIAKECSSIRSSIALFIMGLILSNMFLQTGWRRIIFMLFIFPLSVIKNGIRIVTLSLLAVYIDKSFITHSRLHSEGGIVFFLIALALLMPILWLLRKSEKKAKKVRNI